MDETYIPLSGDDEVTSWLDLLVDRGLLLEVLPEQPDERRFCLTSKGEKILALTEEMAKMIAGGSWSPSTIVWSRN